jgi:tRNA(Ile)-lysidine synthase
MRSRTGDVMRPLLALSREDVLAHLRERGLAWREDSTNADPQLLRNRVRHELLPYLERRFSPGIRETLARTASVAAEEAEILRALGARLVRSVATVKDGGVTLSRPALAALPEAEARLAVRAALEPAGGLKDIGAVHLDRLVQLARAQRASGRRIPLPGGREAVVRFDRIRIESRRPASAVYALALPVPGVVELPDGRRLRARDARGPAVSGARSAVVGAPLGGLEVRTRRPGDRVAAPVGDVSLKRFLIDRRVPADLRGELPLVAAGRRVLWVPGQTAAAAGERFVRLELLPGRPRHNREGA